MSTKTIRLITAGMALASSILALGDKVVQMPGLPGWLTSAWPFVLIGAGIFNHVAQVLITPDAPPKPQDPPNP